MARGMMTATKMGVLYMMMTRVADTGATVAIQFWINMRRSASTVSTSLLNLEGHVTWSGPDEGNVQHMRKKSGPA